MQPTLKIYYWYSSYLYWKKTIYYWYTARHINVVHFDFINVNLARLVKFDTIKSVITNNNAKTVKSYSKHYTYILTKIEIGWFIKRIFAELNLSKTAVHRIKKL